MLKNGGYEWVALALRATEGPLPGAQRAGYMDGVPLRDPVEPCAQHMKRESAGKPGSVVGNHSSGIHVTVDLKRPTRKRARIGAALSHRLLGLR